MFFFQVPTPTPRDLHPKETLRYHVALQADAGDDEKVSSEYDLVLRVDKVLTDGKGSQVQIQIENVRSSIGKQRVGKRGVAGYLTTRLPRNGAPTDMAAQANFANYSLPLFAFFVPEEGGDILGKFTPTDVPVSPSLVATGNGQYVTGGRPGENFVVHWAMRPAGATIDSPPAVTLDVTEQIDARSILQNASGTISDPKGTINFKIRRR